MNENRRPYATWVSSTNCTKIVRSSLDGEDRLSRCARKRAHPGAHTMHQPLAQLLDALEREETWNDLLVLMRSQSPVDCKGCRCTECIDNLPS